MDSSLRMQGAGKAPTTAQRSGVDGHAERTRSHREEERAQREGAWRIAGSLGLIALGVAFGVAVARLHWQHGGVVEPQGAGQSFLLRLYEGLGFVPTLYFFLLAVVWGLFAFFGASIRVALCRLAVALVFVASFASLMSLLGATGGSFGEWVAGRLRGGIGAAPSFVILSALTLMSLMLATDWFFFSQFRRLRPASAPGRSRVGDPADLEDAAPRSAPAFAPTEILGDKLRPVPVPRANVVRAGSDVDAGAQAQALVDLALEDARRSLASGAGASSALLDHGPSVDSGSSAVAVVDDLVDGVEDLIATGGDEDADWDAVVAGLEKPEALSELEADLEADRASEIEREAEAERRRLALRARREAQRLAREESAARSPEEVESGRVEADASEDAAEEAAQAATEAGDARPSVEDIDPPLPFARGDSEALPSRDAAPAAPTRDADYLLEGLHPDEELGLAGLLEPEADDARRDGPFADLEDDDLLEKAGEALEQQWQGGDVGFAAMPGAAPSADAASECASEGRDVAPAREIDVSDPFVAAADRGAGAASAPEAGAPREDADKGPRSWRDAVSPQEPSAVAGREKGDDSVEDASGTDAGESDDFVIEPQPSRREMPTALPAEPDGAEPELLPSEPGSPVSEPESQAQQGHLFVPPPAREGELRPPVTPPPIERLADLDVQAPAEPRELAQAASKSEAAPTAQDERLLDEAAECVLSARRPTPSLLQRRLGLDGLEARRLLDRLAELGAVEEPVDGGAWHPLISYEDWAQQR